MYHVPIYIGNTFALNMKDNLKKIEQELARSLLARANKPLLRPYPRARRRETSCRSTASYTIDLTLISGDVFMLNLRRLDTELYTVSLYEINRILESHDEPEPPTEEVTAKVPAAYQDFYDVFSKAASNVLPPHREYDHQIQLEQAHDLKYSPLYKMTQEELLVVKEYLLDNLDKGFIEPSQAPFTAPVLFVRKPDRSLQFYINYYKLNALTCKDRYSLPLINKTLVRISRAKVFTKLDICQAFYYICMAPDSKELTTFRTCYRAYKCKVLLFGLTNRPITY